MKDRAHERHRPALIVVGMWCSGVFGVIIVAMLLAAAMNVGEFNVDDEQVSGPEFLRYAGVQLTVIAIVLLAISYGLFSERAWARPLMLLYWIMLGAWVVGASIGEVRRGEGNYTLDFAWLIALFVAGWYLYGKANVVSYFASVKAGDEVVAPSAS